MTYQPLEPGAWWACVLCGPFVQGDGPTAGASSGALALCGPIVYAAPMCAIYRLPWFSVQTALRIPHWFEPCGIFTDAQDPVVHSTGIEG